MISLVYLQLNDSRSVCGLLLLFQNINCKDCILKIHLDEADKTKYIGTRGEEFTIEDIHAEVLKHFQIDRNFYMVKYEHKKQKGVVIEFQEDLNFAMQVTPRKQLFLDICINKYSLYEALKENAKLKAKLLEIELNELSRAGSVWPPLGAEATAVAGTSRTAVDGAQINNVSSTS